MHRRAQMPEICEVTRPHASITPLEFSALVEARLEACAPSCPPREGQHSLAPQPAQLKHPVSQYLTVYRKLPLKPRPCKYWLGSAWQQKLAEAVILQNAHTAPPDATGKLPGAEPVQQRLDSSVPHGSSSAAPSSGMSKAFLDKLKTRRRDELKKAQEKAAEEKREQERIARSNAKILQAKKLKLEALNRERVVQRSEAQRNLAAKAEAATALASRLEQTKKELHAVDIEKHDAVTQLKARRAEQSVLGAAGRGGMGGLDVEMQTSPGMPASALPEAMPQPSDPAIKEEAPAQGRPPQRSCGDTEVVTLSLGVVAHAPTFPPPSGSLVQRLFGTHETESSRKEKQEGHEQVLDIEPLPGVKRKREEDSLEGVHPKVPHAASLPAALPAPPAIPAPVRPNTAGGYAMRAVHETGAMRGKRGDGGPAGRASGGFMDDMRPRVQGPGVFSGVRGGPPVDKRSEKGSFISRPSPGPPSRQSPGPPADISQGFLPRARDHERPGEEKASGVHGAPFTGAKPGSMAEGLKTRQMTPPPLPTLSAFQNKGTQDSQGQFLPPPPLHSSYRTDDVPPPPWPVRDNKKELP